MRGPIRRLAVAAALAAASVKIGAAQTPPPAGSSDTAPPSPTPAKAPRPTIAAGAKISGTLECEKPERTSMEVADAPGHVLAIGKAACRWTKPLVLGRLRTYKGESKSMRDEKGDTALERGYHVGRTGGKGYVYSFRFDGQTRLVGGASGTLQGRWAFTGGTGELEGLQGAGRYRGTYDENGATKIEFEGEYRLREPAAPERTP
jgi:hypothetical protein